MKTRRETRYRVEYRRFGIWRKMDTFGTQDEAYEYLQDQEYFDNKEGLPFTRYRVRKISVKAKFRNPTDYVFSWEYSPHGCYLLMTARSVISGTQSSIPRTSWRTVRPRTI